MAERPSQRLSREGVTFHKVNKEGPLNREDITALVNERQKGNAEGAPGAASEAEQEVVRERLRTSSPGAGGGTAPVTSGAQGHAAHAGGHGGGHGGGFWGLLGFWLWSVPKAIVMHVGKNIGMGGGGGHGGGHTPAKKDSHAKGGGHH